jgi:Mg-chelatase subunit ChlD
LWEARTDNYGRAELFNGLFGQPVDAEQLGILVHGNESVFVEDLVPTTDDGRIEIALEAAQTEAPILDVMFAVDATGSMGDELEYLKAELTSVLDQVKVYQSDQGDALTVRTSVNFYRDEGDEYLVKSFPFTTDFELVNEQVGAQSAGGGGDFPEAVEAALEDGVNEHQWSKSARARLLFLVLDAPPHSNKEAKESLHKATREAAKKGIRIIPIVASGIDKSTEFLMRFLDVATGGTYVFITNDSGIGGNHIEPTIGSYVVQKLNMLLFELITDAVMTP